MSLVLWAKKEAWEWNKVWRMNLHTPKGASTLGIGVVVDSQMFKEWLQGSKPNGLKSSLYNWNAIET
jgi:hypothetical protein